jgi:cyclohexanone monooxygenase
MLRSEIADFQKMNQIRGRVDAIVKDPQTAEKLKPWYRQFCKRPTFNDEYLETFNRPNVTLVDVSDSEGRRAHHAKRRGRGRAGSTRSTASSSRRVSRSPRSRTGVWISTRSVSDGLSLYEHWKDGFRTLHGLASPRLPQLVHDRHQPERPVPEHDRHVRRSGRPREPRR